MLCRWRDEGFVQSGLNALIFEIISKNVGFLTFCFYLCFCDAPISVWLECNTKAMSESCIASG